MLIAAVQGRVEGVGRAVREARRVDGRPRVVQGQARRLEGAGRAGVRPRAVLVVEPCRRQVRGRHVVCIPDVRHLLAVELDAEVAVRRKQAALGVVEVLLRRDGRVQVHRAHGDRRVLRGRAGQ